MAQLKPDASTRLIPQSIFQTCVLDSLALADICELYTRQDLGKTIAYRLDKLIHHLKVRHGMTIIDYCEKHLSLPWPVCPIKGVKVGYRVSGKGLVLSTYAQGAIDTSLPANQAFYRRMAEERRGEGNPMYGKVGWNAGLTVDDDPRVAHLVASMHAGRDALGHEERSRQAKENYQRIKHVFHHRMPHSEETKQKCRVNTARLWAEGVFNRTSSIHLKMREFLKTLPLVEQPVEEYQVKWFSMDFAFPEHKVAIECQGTFYHIDPRVYPDGPETAIQRRNHGRDKAKRITCCDREGWIIIEAWEIEINSGQFKDDITCKLKQYGLLAS